MRKKLIAGNWKMNSTISSATKLVDDIKNLIPSNLTNTEVLVCPPFTNLFSVRELLNGSEIKLGAQNCEYRKSGAYTGEISVEMIKAAGCDYVILGHSERRQYYHESDYIIGLKIKSVLDEKLTPIFCIGETISERNSGSTFTVLSSQIKNAFANLTSEEIDKVVIAYEPVWAIGTGITATKEQAAEAHKWIRNYLSENFTQNSETIKILYGGSMNEKNCLELLEIEDIDGGLIGGASLKADSFISIIKASESLTNK